MSDWRAARSVQAAGHKFYAAGLKLMPVTGMHTVTFAGLEYVSTCTQVMPSRWGYVASGTIDGSHDLTFQTLSTTVCNFVKSNISIATVSGTTGCTGANATATARIMYMRDKIRLECFAPGPGNRYYLFLSDIAWTDLLLMPSPITFTNQITAYGGVTVATSTTFPAIGKNGTATVQLYSSFP